MNLTIEQMMGLAVTVIGGLGWLFRLESRVSSHEASCVQRQKQLDERHTGIQTTLESINHKLDRLVEHQ